MAFNVRIFGYRGMTQLPVTLPKQFASDAVYQLTQPYEWRETVSATGAAASTAAQAAPDQTRIVRIEVPDGETIRYEINPPNRSGGAVVAGANSPSLSGINHFEFAQGWTISIIDAAGL